MFVLEERTGARYLYGHIGPSAHALQADTFPAGASHLEGENVSVGAGATDSVTIALKNLEWAPNPVTGNSTLRVWTDCRVADVQRFSFVGLADDYSFRGGAGANSIVANVNVNDQWSITVPGNATLIGRHEVNTVFRMDIQTPSGPMLWEKPLFVAQGPAGRYNATVTNASDGFLMLAVLA
jgi:hypothetical protein